MKLLPTLLLLLCLAGACKKNEDPAPGPVTGTSIYLCGSVNKPGNTGSVPCYWKDTALVTLSVPAGAYGSAVAIVQQGTDIYVAGSYNLNGNFSGGYWKNGVATMMPSIEGFPHVSVSDIFLNGNDIYVAGACENSFGNGRPCYWKNGAVTVISDILDANRISSAFSIAVSGNDVFVCGKSGQLDKDVASLWKNGVRSNLIISHPTKWSYATSIIAINATTYAGGSASDENGTKQQAIVWRSGAGEILQTQGDAGVADIAVNGTTLYAAGYYQKQFRGFDEPCYWLNTALTALPAFKTGNAAKATGIKLSGEDVYVSGWGYDTNGVVQPAYWKNGVLKQLKALDITQGGVAEDIFIGK